MVITVLSSARLDRVEQVFSVASSELKLGKKVTANYLIDCDNFPPSWRLSFSFHSCLCLLHKRAYFLPSPSVALARVSVVVSLFSLFIFFLLVCQLAQWLLWHNTLCASTKSSMFCSFIMRSSLISYPIKAHEKKKLVITINNFGELVEALGWCVEVSWRALKHSWKKVLSRSLIYTIEWSSERRLDSIAQFSRVGFSVCSAGFGGSFNKRARCFFAC